eukprot:1045871-Pyramimonas_sp.AAC.1
MGSSCRETRAPPILPLPMSDLSPNERKSDTSQPSVYRTRKPTATTCAGALKAWPTTKTKRRLSFIGNVKRALAARGRAPKSPQTAPRAALRAA